MIKNIIFDYMGVLANIDYKNMQIEMPMFDKFKVLRILVALKKNDICKQAWSDYQIGKINQSQFCNILMEVYPNSASITPTMLNLIPDNIKENDTLLDVVKALHNDGYKIILLSNSIPETQIKIQNSELVNYFDGFVLSNLVGMAKPNQQIYNLACDTYNLIPQETLFIDDKPENLAGAKSIGLNTMLCENPKKLSAKLENMFYMGYQPQLTE